MKIEGRIFAGRSRSSSCVVAAVYGVLSREVDRHHGPGPQRRPGLRRSAFYCLRLAARLGPRPEDRPDAEIDDGAGEYGFFSPHSWWPLPTALSAAIMMLGFVFAWWLTVLGAFMLISARSASSSSTTGVARYHAGRVG